MYRKILVAVDGSRSSRRAVQEAIRIAPLARAQVRSVFVLDWAPVFPYTCHYNLANLENAFTRQGEAALEEATRLLTEAGIAADAELVKTADMTEDVAECLRRYASQYGPDLVIMGTHGRRGVGRAVLGSVAERFLRIATCPVLLVRDERSAG